MRAIPGEAMTSTELPENDAAAERGRRGARAPRRRAVRAAAALALAAALAGGCGGGVGNPEALVVVPAQEPAVAPVLPPTEVANAAPDGPLEPAEAFRLVEQSTFGPRLEDIGRAASLGPEGWIDAQMGKPATYLLAGLARSAQPDRWNEHVNVWWRHAIGADDQLRQRVAFALSEILVDLLARTGSASTRTGLAAYYDILLRHAFGNYRDLLEEVTLSPMMGEYLSMKGNRKPDLEENVRPDENYARELLQLFSIGPVVLNPTAAPSHDADGVPLPTYDQSVVEGFAHVFTGWHFANAEDFRWPKNKDWISPMRAWPDFHDTGEKRLLDGVVLPAGQTPERGPRGGARQRVRAPERRPVHRQAAHPAARHEQPLAGLRARRRGGVRAQRRGRARLARQHRQGDPDAPRGAFRPPRRTRHLRQGEGAAAARHPAVARVRARGDPPGVPLRLGRQRARAGTARRAVGVQLLPPRLQPARGRRRARARRPRVRHPRRELGGAA